MGRYEARRVDLKTLAAVAALYGKLALSDSINRESDSPGGNGAGMDPGAMVLRLREVGLPALLCATDPGLPPYQVWQAGDEGCIFLARMKGHGAQLDPFWGIAWYHGDGAIAVVMHMPADVAITVPAPFCEAWTGIGIVITRRLPEGVPYLPQASPN